MGTSVGNSGGSCTGGLALVGLDAGAVVADTPVPAAPELVPDVASAVAVAVEEGGAFVAGVGSAHPSDPVNQAVAIANAADRAYAGAISSSCNVGATM